MTTDFASVASVALERPQHPHGFFEALTTCRSRLNLLAPETLPLSSLKFALGGLCQGSCFVSPILYCPAVSLPSACCCHARCPLVCFRHSQDENSPQMS